MIRVSEAVLPGHPDKFCDQIADAIVAESYRVDPRAYCQVEVSIWSDQVWISGGVATRETFERPRLYLTRPARRAAGRRRYPLVEGGAGDQSEVVGTFAGVWSWRPERPTDTAGGGDLSGL